MNDGETGQAEELLAQLRAHPYASNTGLVVYHLVRREFDAAVECALKAVDERLPCLNNLVLRQNEPPLRQSAHWPALLRKLNLA